MVDETQQYSAAEMERIMKVQDVLLKAIAKKITWWAAAEIIGVTDRTMRRWRGRLERDGYTGLADRRRGKASAQRIPLATVGKVLSLYKETYYDLNIRHFHEKLRDEHGIELSYTWVQKALQGAGLVAKRHKRGPHRRRRPRRPLPGMLLHIDGSKHRWLNDDRWYDLIVILDDATSEIYYAQLVEEESTRTVMAGLREVIETQGLFCALYSDRGSHFFVTVKEGEKVDKHRLTQVGRAMKELGIQMIAAYSPQARGRSERSFGTWQGRLPQELRLAGITSTEGANAFLRERYIGEFNSKFQVPAVEKGTAFRRTSRGDLNWIFTVQTERVVAKDNTVAMGSRLWQIDKTRFRNTLAGSRVTIHEHLDGTVSIRFGPHVAGRYSSAGEKLISTRPTPKQRRGKGGSMEAGENQKQVSTASHTPLEISPKTRDSHFPTAPTTASVFSRRKAKAKTKTRKAGGLKAASLCFTKRTDH
jgi:transposase